MATKQDIFAGSYVKVSLNKDLSSEIPSYFDPGYIFSNNIAQFPTVEVKQEIQSFEEYRDDFETKLAGDVVIQDTTLSVLEVFDDPFIEALDNALENKTKLRFRNLYVIDTENGENSQNGLYNIFDGYVTKVERTGSNDSAVTLNYRISPEGRAFQGFALTGEVLRQGDYGIGAGTTDFPGVSNLGSLAGNSWITVDASLAANPFHDNTSAMAIQNITQGWELIATSSGKPCLRVRNKQLSSDGSTVLTSEWTKVYTESEKPTPAEIGAFPKTGGQIDGNITVTGTVTSRGKLIANTADIKNIVGAAAEFETVKTNDITSETGSIDDFTSTTIKSDSVKVKGEEVYSPSNKPTPAEIGAIAIGATVDFGYYD